MALRRCRLGGSCPTRRSTTLDNYSRWRTITVYAVTVVLVAPVVVSTPADADPITGVTCAASTYSAGFNPGITLTTPQTVAVTVEFRLVNCLSLSQPTITLGAVDKQVTFDDFSCLSLLLPVHRYRYYPLE